MANRPEIGGSPNYYEWASSSLTQVVVIDGKVLVLNNKEAPLTEFTTFGLKYGQAPIFQEINYQFNGYSQWFEHLDQRYAVGDLHKTTSAEDQTAISARLGGTWTNIGTESVGAQTIQIWEKTA